MPKNHAKPYLREDYYLIKRLPVPFTIITWERIIHCAVRRGN